MIATLDILKRAKVTAQNAAKLNTALKNAALLAMADGLEARAEEILQANETDLANARGVLPEVMLDRLKLTTQRILGMAQGIREVAQLPDPIGEILEENVRPNGLKIVKKRVPLGVVGVIYESRPNVTSDAAALCFKSGNVCVLRGGKDAYFSSAAIVNVLRGALARVGVDENFINIVEDVSRQSALEMMTAVGYIDALIPRGGAGLIRSCVENAKVPCIETGTGICHVYVDEDADLQKALAIIDNAKTSRPSVCNAEEVCLVHQAIAKDFLPLLKQKLIDERVRVGLQPVQLRCAPIAYSILGGEALPAGERDFDTEFLDYILAVKVVAGVNEAIEHIARHSTRHSEAIVTENAETAETFVSFVDSAAVYINASTRFTDGGEFGKGCEIGISTQKLHARGPMGLEEMTSYKYVVTGIGQIR